MPGSSSAEGVTEDGARRTPEDVRKRQNDNPIEAVEDDRLQRTGAAQSFVRQVLELDASRGATVGVFGPWGSGKTSFVNLALLEFEGAGVPTLAFNPWMFSETEQLVVRFFGELSAGLGKNEDLQDVGRAIARYSGAIVGAANLASAVFAGVPGLGKVLEPFLNAVEASTDRAGIGELREAVEAALRQRERPIVVVLDDVDRLTFEEIRLVFKLIRLTANFPNLVYVVVCDRHRVEQALDEQGGGGGFGRDYLEKIIQYPFDLPAVPRHLLRREFEDALTDALAGLELDPFNMQELWPDVCAYIIEPLIRNMRDVRRYAIAVAGTATDLAGEVEMVDLLGLEAIRLFLPGVFGQLHGAVDAITYPSASTSDERALRALRDGEGETNLRLKKVAQNLVDAGADRPGVVEASLKTMFPYGYWSLNATTGADRSQNTSDRDPAARRVADESVLRLYLEGVAGEDIGVLKVAERALRSLDDGETFEQVLRSVDPPEILEVIRELCRLSDRFEPAHAEPGVVVLLNLLREIPNELSFWHSPRQAVRSAVFRLLRVVGDEEAVGRAVKRILPNLKTLAAKVELLHLVGHSLLESERLVTPEVSRVLDSALAEKIRESFERDEIDNPDEYAWIVSFPARVGKRINLPDSPELAFRLAHSAYITTRSDRSVSRSLDWDFLGLLYGDKETAVARVRTMCAAFDVQRWANELARWCIAPQEAEETIEMSRESLPPDGKPGSHSP